MESKIRHLEMIQNVISRMNSNSFLLKGWTVTIVVALFAFANIKDMDSNFIVLAIIPTLFFWGLDAFFVHQEWLFVKLYEFVTTQDEEDINFSMKTTPFEHKVKKWKEALLSKTILSFYFPIIILIVVAYIWLR
ncbi:hypothetical protein [Priestia megaterium]|uniref:hypothetical protein n=1 Tax=Priestia megaterium TaxID=1404 RepID=UPI000BFB36B3|nr:hypothetical protein [Priestia megaterium]PGT77451.1 hypothetical protein COD15_01640 [Priestia megaterium]